MTALFGVLALLAYSYGLGAAAVIVWRRYRGSVWAYVPGAATAAYYALCFTVAPPFAFKALRGQVPYTLEDVARNWAFAVAFGSALYLISRPGGRHETVSTRPHPGPERE